MNKPYKIYRKKTKRNLTFVFSTAMAGFGCICILGSVGLFPPIYHFFQHFHNAMEFLNSRIAQFILGAFLVFICGRLWLRTIKRIFNNTPTLIADDFGLESNFADNYNVIAWEYIDGISIENYAVSNSQSKRPTLIIRYRGETSKKQNTEIFIPISFLTGRPKKILNALNARRKTMKF